MTRALRVAAFDGGLTKLGAAHLSVWEGGIAVNHARLYVTMPDAEGSRSEDGARRVGELSGYVLEELCGSPTVALAPVVDVVVMEAFSKPPHVTAALKLAMGLTVLQTWCAYLKLPIVQVSPQAIKGALEVEAGLSQDESKRKVQEAVDLALFPLDGPMAGGTLAGRHLHGINASNLQHPYDAVAAALCALRKGKLKLMMGALR